MINKKFLTGSIFLLLISGAGLIWLSPAELNIAPPVTFRTLDGRQVNLKNLEGRPVLVTFWATTCTSCIKEMPHLVSLYNDLSIKGLEIIGVAMAYDPPNQVLEVTKQQHIPYMISLDIDGAIAKAFDDVQFTPTTFLIAQDGKIIRHKTGKIDMEKLREQIKGLLSQKVQVTSNGLQETGIDTGA